MGGWARWTRVMLAGVSSGLLLGTAGTAVAGAGGFVFAPPAGWIDISRGAPEAQRQKAPPALLEQANNGQMAYVAFEPDSADDGFVENMNAVVQTGKHPLLATPTGLAEMEKGLEGEIAKRGMTYRSLKIEVVKVAGVPAGRLVGEVTLPSGPVAMVQYAIPGNRAQAMLTFTTTPDKLARYEPVFDGAVQAIRGAVDPRNRSSEQLGTLSGAIAGGIGGAIGVLLMRRAKRKRQAAATPPPPAPLNG